MNVYCAVLDSWMTREEISTNLLNLIGISSFNINKRLINEDLNWLAEIGYIERKKDYRNPRSKMMYRLSDNLEKARRRYQLIRVA